MRVHISLYLLKFCCYIFLLFIFKNKQMVKINKNVHFREKNRYFTLIGENVYPIYICIYIFF